MMMIVKMSHLTFFQIQEACRVKHYSPAAHQRGLAPSITYPSNFTVPSCSRSGLNLSNVRTARSWPLRADMIRGVHFCPSSSTTCKENFRVTADKHRIIPEVYTIATGSTGQHYQSKDWSTSQMLSSLQGFC